MSMNINDNSVLSKKDYSINYSCTFGNNVVLVTSQGSDHTTNLPMYNTKSKFNRIDYLKNKLNYIKNKIKFKLKLNLRRKKIQKKDIQHLTPNESKLGRGAEKVYTAKQVIPEYNNMMDQNINLENMCIKKNDIIGQGGQALVRGAQKKYNKNTPNKLYKNYVVKTTKMNRKHFREEKDFLQSQQLESNIQQQLSGSPKIIAEQYLSESKENNILMEKSGISFEKILREKEQDPKLKKIILKQIIDQVAKMHAKGIAHCDLKPDNILVNSDGKAQLIDFGTAEQEKITEYDQLAFKSGGYTLPYRAPERDRKKSFSVQSDIWSLGMILLRNLTKKLPMLYNSDTHELKKDKLDTLLRDVKIVDMSKYGDKAAQQLLGQMLSLDPRERPTAQEILNHPYFAIPDDVNQASFLELQTEYQRLFDSLVDIESEDYKTKLVPGTSYKKGIARFEARIKSYRLALKLIKEKIKLKSLLINQQKIMAKQQKELKSPDVQAKKDLKDNMQSYSFKKKVDENYNELERQLNELNQEIQYSTGYIERKKIEIQLADSEIEKLGM